MRYLFLAVLLFSSTSIFSQSLKMGSLISEFNRNGEIEGIIYDGENENEPLVFAEVIVKETNISAETTIDGTFKLSLKPGNYSLIFSFIGYRSIEVANVEVTSNSKIKLNQILNPLKMSASITEINVISKTK